MEQSENIFQCERTNRLQSGRREEEKKKREREKKKPGRRGGGPSRGRKQGSDQSFLAGLGGLWTG